MPSRKVINKIDEIESTLNDIERKTFSDIVLQKSLETQLNEINSILNKKDTKSLDINLEKARETEIIKYYHSHYWRKYQGKNHTIYINDLIGLTDPPIYIVCIVDNNKPELIEDHWDGITLKKFLQKENLFVKDISDQTFFGEEPLKFRNNKSNQQKSYCIIL